MDYARIYSQLMHRGKLRVCVDGYSERHHILPRCMGGSNDSSNLVALTAREHFLAHMLLGKIHGGVLWHAVTIMSDDGRINSRLFDIARKGLSTRMLGNTNTLGRKAPDFERQHMSAIRKGKPGRKQSEATKQKIREANLGKKLSEVTKQKLSDGQRGKAKPEGFGIKIAAAQLIQSKHTRDKRAKSLESYYATQRLLLSVSVAANSNIQESKPDEMSAFVYALLPSVAGLSSNLQS